jgi:hypothetical protein
MPNPPRGHHRTTRPPPHHGPGVTGVAKDYHSTEKLEPGDVVVIDPAASGISIRRSQKPYAPALVGVISASPAIRISQDQSDPARESRSAAPDQYPVAAIGRVAVKVCADNGPIHPGDYLTSSSRPGVAIKATTKGPVIGKALQPFTGQDVHSIQLLINVTVYVP